MKARVIPDVSLTAQAVKDKGGLKELLFRVELASYQLVGRVMAYQGF